MCPKEQTQTRKNYFNSKRMIRTRKTKIKDQAFQEIDPQKLLSDIENVPNKFLKITKTIDNQMNIFIPSKDFFFLQLSIFFKI